ncbi:MAG TPA: packaged DNA stabilization protein [Woeseiaceae bacterium]
MRLGLGKSHYDRDEFAEIILQNWIVEPSDSDGEQFSLLSRKGLVEFANYGSDGAPFDSGVVDGIYAPRRVDEAQLGAQLGGLFYVVGGELVLPSVGSLGAVTGTGPVSFASNSNELLVARGGSLHRYKPFTGFSTVTFPDNQEVIAVAYLRGRFLAVPKGTEKIYFSAINDATSWGALDFFSAEQTPDGVRDIRVVGETLAVLGSSTIENFATTASASAPYQRIELGGEGMGVIATGACAVVHASQDEDLAFVGMDRNVHFKRQHISPAWLSAKIDASARLFAFDDDGHHYLVLTLDSGTFVYNMTSGAWVEYTSYGKAHWRPSCWARFRGVGYFGDSFEPVVWEHTGNADGDDPISRVATAICPPLPALDNLVAEMSVGATADLTEEPLVEMRISRNQGRTYGDWRRASLGKTGEYGTRAIIRRWGSVAPPGAVVQLRFADTADFRPRLSSIRANEFVGGRRA